MSILRRFAVLSLAFLVLLGYSAAHSQSRGALSRVSLVGEPRILTPSGRVHALSSFDLTFSLYAGEYLVRLSLEPNHDIIADGASVQYLDSNGNIARTELIDRHEHKVFKGRAWGHLVGHGWHEVGWARVVIRRDGKHPLFEGAFTMHHNHHHIQLRSNYMQTKHHLDPLLNDANDDDDETMIVFRDSDILSEDNLQLRRSVAVGCPADELSFNLRPEHAFYPKSPKDENGFWGSTAISSLLGKRQIDTNPSGGNSGGVNLKSTIGQTAGCPSTRKVALVGVAADCTYTGTFNSTETARQNVITQINSASDLYEKSFNITLGLQNLTVSDSNCPGSQQEATPWNTACSNNVTIQDRLNTFSQWRGSRNDSNAYWTLLTNCNTGSAVGLAWLGQACVSGLQTSQDSGGGSESVSSANVVARTSTEWQVIAHETGHTFGAVHDCTSETCSDSNTVNAQQCCPLSNSTCDAGERYIMNPSTGQGITQFSPCSIGNICSAIGRNSVKTNCLVANKDISTISGGQCGNGIVEDGEDCDCGGTESCGDNACCDPSTCKFKNNAVCDDSNEDCCQNCQFAPSSKVCRGSTGECDPEERCTGSSATCPQDQTAPDGQRCGNSSLSLTCASGQCTSRDQQCKVVIGSYTQTNDTYACDNSGCIISCASPEFGPSVCYRLQQNFLDGTPCGGGGKCQNGKCKGSSTSKEIRSWIDDHKALVIGVASAVGGFLLLMFLGCLWRCCRRANYKRKVPPQAHTQWMPPSVVHQPPYGPYGVNEAWHSPPPPPPPLYHQHMSSARYA